MIDHEYTGTVLRVGDVEHDLPATVADALEVDGVLVVRLQPGEGTPERNVLGFDWSGTQVWEIDRDGRSSRSSTFLSLDEVADGEAHLRSWNSFVYRLDSTDGSIERVGKWDK